MIFTRFILLISATALLGACGSPANKGESPSRSKAYAVQGGSSFHVGEASFPIAAPPRFDGDGRTQEERDLETIGRKN
jgi:hypothetical protein